MLRARLLNVVVRVIRVAALLSTAKVAVGKHVDTLAPALSVRSLVARSVSGSGIIRAVRLRESSARLPMATAA